MKELQSELREMYEEIEKLKSERDVWKKEASEVENKDLRFDLCIKYQNIDKEIRNIKIEMMEKFKNIIEW